MSRSGNMPSPLSLMASWISSVALLVATIYPATAAASADESTSTVHYTSTITIVQTIHPSTAVAAVATNAASTASNERSYTDDAVFENIMINVSNTARQDYNASSLVWNDTLADYAQSWSERCKFEHSNGPYGENLAATYPSATAAITAWVNESTHFNFADPGFTESTGHFSQMVWKSTTSVGCGRKFCGSSSASGDDQNHANGWYVVCSYWPRGNVIGAFGANVDAAVDGSGSDWDDEGMIARTKNGVGKASVQRAILGAQLLALVWLGMT